MNILRRPTQSQIGVGLRAQHYLDVINTRPNIGWFEVHSENYFGQYGKPLYYLEKISQNYPLSFHGVGLSLGSMDPLDERHLEKLKNLVQRFEPFFVSEHLCWSSFGGTHLNDLLPLPYTEESLNHVVSRINKVQEHLNKTILIENISAYLQFAHSTISENEFITEVAIRTGCGILLDVNNLYVNAVNHGVNAKLYLQSIPIHLVKELHLAGFAENHFKNGSILIDAHNRPVAKEVWELYKETLIRFGSLPTLIEWDKDIPALDVLVCEAQKAQRVLESIDAITA